MPERYIVIDHLKLSYDGLFKADELFTVISGWFYEKGWDWYEKMNEEQITPTGKQIRIILEPFKNVTDYYKMVVSIKLIIKNVTEVEVESKGELVKLNHGLIRMTLDAFLVTDRKGKWMKKPFLWFLSVIFDKYFFREPFTKMEDWLKREVDDLYNRIKNYLNVFKYSYHS